jgi:hypothetical protein
MRFDLDLVRERIAALAQVDPPAAPEAHRRPCRSRALVLPGVKQIQGRSSR